MIPVTNQIKGVILMVFFDAVVSLFKAAVIKSI